MSYALLQQAHNLGHRQHHLDPRVLLRGKLGTSSITRLIRPFCMLLVPLPCRWGREDGYCIIDGQKVPIQRVWDKMMRGLPTRDYGAVVKDFSTAYGIDKSAA